MYRYWYTYHSLRNHVLTGTTIQAQAKEVAKKPEKSEFLTYNRELENVTNRCELVFNEVCGEAADGCEETVAEWVAKLSSVLDGYYPKDTCKW
jgi:hypothetical protein